MYKVDDKAKWLYLNEYRQVARLVINTTSDEYEVTEEDIVQGTFSVDRYSTTSDNISLGSACSTELKFSLYNNDGKFDNIKFEGATIYAQIGIKKWDAHNWENAVIHWLPLGYFIVDNQPKSLDTIEISALDRMVLFDKTVSEIALPKTVKQLVQMACYECNVTLLTDISQLPNSDFTITEINQDEYTWRNIIQWCSQLMATNAYFNADGSLEMSWTNETDVVFDLSNRYSSSFEENDIEITGIEYSTDETTYRVGVEGYCVDISDNGLVSEDTVSSALPQMWNVINGFTYRPFNAEVKPFPYLMPLDTVVFVDKNGTEYKSVLTNVNYVMNAGTSVASKGETSQASGYANGADFTDKQAKIIKFVQEQTKKSLTLNERNTLRMNELLSNSLGLNLITDVQEIGTKYYFCDNQTLEGSTIIYTLQANGFAWTTDWNDGDPVWQYGFTKDGGAIFRYINSAQISADQIYSGTLRLGGLDNVSGQLELYDNENNRIGQLNKDGLRLYSGDGYIVINPSDGFVGYDNNGEKVYWVSKDEFHQKKAVVEEEITIGKWIRILPITISNGVTISNRGVGFVPVEEIE